MKVSALYEEPIRKFSPSDEELEIFHGYEEEFDEELYDTETGHRYDCRCGMCREADKNEYFLSNLWNWGKGLFDDSSEITYAVKPGEEFGGTHKSKRPPGLPSWARKAGEKLSALPHVRDLAKNEKLGSVFVKAIEQMAKSESQARFALPAILFNANPPSDRLPGEKLVTAWGVFQFNRDAWTCLYPEKERTSKKSYVPKATKGTQGCKGCRGKGGCVFPWDCTAKEEIERPIKKYAQLFRNVLNAGGSHEDAAAGLRIWHKSPTYYLKWLNTGTESNFKKAWWSDQLTEKFRNSIKSFLNKASIAVPYKRELIAFDHSGDDYESHSNQVPEIFKFQDEFGELEINHFSDIQKLRNILDFPIIRKPYPDETLEEYLTWHDDGPNNFGYYFSAAELIKLHRPYNTPCTISPKKLPRKEIPPRNYWHRIIPTRFLAGYLRHRIGVPLNVGHGWRPKWFNSHVCGKPASQHLKFSAMDIDLPSGYKSREMMEKFYSEAVKIYIAVGPLFDMGLGLYRSYGYGPRVHVDTGWKMRTWNKGYAKKVADNLGLALPKP